MLFENLWIIINYSKLLLILLPIFLFGIILLRIITVNLKISLLIPGGIILGLTFFTFLLNLSFNILSSKPAIILTFSLITVAALILIRTINRNIKLNKTILFIALLSFLFWSGLVAWKANFALIGGDTRSYYAIAGSFTQGNFPAVTPWQPDVELAYHIGAFELLAALNYLTGISFLPLHLILSIIFITCVTQILVWTISENFTIPKFIIANFAALIAFISFGFIKIAYPIFPLKFPEINTVNNLVIWLRNLPQVRESIELYGVSFNLDSLIYILFQNFGLAILFCILVILLNLRKNFLGLFVILICLASLALVNETIFIPALVPVFLYVLLTYPKKLKTWTLVFVAFLITGLVILFQGGMITANFLSKDNTPSSIEIFARSSGVFDYLLNSQKSRILQINESWKPFGWINIGIDLLLISSVILLYFSKPERKLRNFCILLMGFSIGAILTYNSIIPKYVLSNSNRILVLAYQFLSIITLVLALTWILRIKNLRLKYLALILFTLVVLLPTILPPLAWMSTTRFGSNKLLPTSQTKSELEKWLSKNSKPDDRFAVLDINSPHPSGAANLMEITGIKTPLFVGGFKTYTIEPGPEYTDIVYSLNPESLQKLKVNKLIIDNKYYETLPEMRKADLNNEGFFKSLFEEKTPEGWQKVYEVQPIYFLEGKNLSGSFEDLNRIAPKDGKFFIDSQKNFYIDYIRRPLIFTLRDRDLYFDAESGVYQHTETPVNIKAPEPGLNYDYLVLSDKSDPKKICNCEPKLIWKYLNGKIILWKV